MQTVVWRAVGASVQGASHIETNLPCQDAHHYQYLPNGTILLAVADGAGSAARSQDGSQLVVTHALASLATELATLSPSDATTWQEVIKRACVGANQALLDFAAREGTTPRSFATTLLLGVLTDTWLALGQIGDGCAIAQNSAGDLFTALHPQRGEYANTSYFLGTADALEHLEVAVYTEAITALVLTTDGLLRLALTLPALEPHPPFFTPLFEFVTKSDDQTLAETQLTRFLASDRVSQRTDDDKTLLITVRIQPLVTEPSESSMPEEQDHANLP